MESPSWEYRVMVFQTGVSHEFRFGGGPLEYPNSAQPVFFALGLLSATWARLEQQIDMILVQINKSHHSSEMLALYDPKHPVSFSRKLDLFRKYFKHHPALEPHKETILKLIPNLRALSKHRNRCLHAIVEDYDQTKQAVVLNSVKYQGRDALHAEQRTVALEAIMIWAGVNNQANRDLAKISRQLFTPEALKQLGTISRPTQGRTSRRNRARS